MKDTIIISFVITMPLTEPWGDHRRAINYKRLIKRVAEEYNAKVTDAVAPMSDVVKKILRMYPVPAKLITVKHCGSIIDLHYTITINEYDMVEQYKPQKEKERKKGTKTTWWIVGDIKKESILQWLNIVLGKRDEKELTWHDCTIPKNAFKELDNYYGEIIWGPEKKNV